MFRMGDIYNVVGNVWDHTRTPFHPFSGFKIQQNFEDYSAPYFGAHHSLLFGGSFASGLKDVYVTRNWFRHHFYNFIGFRYTISAN
jgi:formylglycine-generating enzyme required for sulfatase activity